MIAVPYDAPYIVLVDDALDKTTKPSKIKKSRNEHEIKTHMHVLCICMAFSDAFGNLLGALFVQKSVLSL